jgi:ribonuclease HI
LNFDGASKGNMGPIGIGGVFKDSDRKIILLFSSFRGIDTNNSSELQALEAGLVVTKKHN